MKNSALLATVLLLAMSKADDAVDCQGMRVKQLRTFLARAPPRPTLGHWQCPVRCFCARATPLAQSVA